MLTIGNKSFSPYQFNHTASHASDVRFCGGEMEVHQHKLAGLDKGFGQDIFAGASLVSRQKVAHTKHFLDGIDQAVAGFGTGIRVVGNAHGGHLIVAHGVHARVGEHVHEYVSVLQQECVVAGLFDFFQTFFHRKQVQFLHHAHLVHFHRNLVLGIIKFNLHIFSLIYENYKCVFSILVANLKHFSYAWRHFERKIKKYVLF